MPVEETGDDRRRVFEVVLPMRIKTSAKKNQALNLNVYRNLHFRSLSSQKNKFYKIAKKLLQGIPPLGVITLDYVINPETKRRIDIMNFGSIVDKYFSDSLTECGIIEDDDYKRIPKVTFAFGRLVKDEHILVTITEIEPREEAKPMRVLLDTADIQKALTDYVGTLNIPNASGVQLDYANGVITAEVLFGTAVVNEDDGDNAPEPTPVETPKKRGRGGRPRGSKNLPKPDVKEASDVDTTVSDGPSDGGGGDDTPSEGPAVADDTIEPAKGDEPRSTGTKKGNLFGDEGSPSSETDGSEEVALDSAPVPEPVKRGSIFDA